MNGPREHIFVGRADEIDSLERVIEGGVRLVTIVGPLGAGKTRLATEFCGRRGESACFIDLTDVFERSDFLRKIASTLGISLASLASGHATEQLASALEASDFDVVVLDNFEQLVSSCARVVDELIGHPGLPLLVVTTREAVGIAGEVRISLGPLPAEDALELFERRARDVVPAFEIPGGDRDVVEELLGELDNLPLVIELAATRASVLPPVQLLRRLHERFTHIREVTPTRSPRQASLEGAISWSWELLDEKERRALMEVSVFRGGMSLDAAQAVLDVTDPIGTMQSLVDKSLLRREVSRRDALDARFKPYESVRAYASNAMDEELRQSAEAAHARFFAEAASDWASAIRDGGSVEEQRDGLARLDEEFGNLAAIVERSVAPELATEVALALDCLLEARGPVETRRRILQAAPRHTPRVLVALAETEIAAGEPERAEATLLEADEEGRLEARIALARARAARARGDVSEAAEFARRVLDVADDARLEVTALANLAVVVEPSEAIEHAEAAVRRLSRIDDARLGLMVRNVAGTVAMSAGDLDTARAQFVRSLPDARTLGESRLEAALLSNLALVDHYRGRLEDAARQFREAHRAFRRIGLPREAALALGNVAAVLIELERWDDAAVALTEATETLGDLSGPQEGVLLATRGNLHHARGDLARALELYERASESFDGRSPHAASTRVYQALAEIESGPRRRGVARLHEVSEGSGTTVWRLAAATALWWFGEGDRPDLALLRGLPPYVREGFESLSNETTSPWLFVVLLRRTEDRRVDRDRPSESAPDAEADLVVDANGYWFEVAGSSERVDIRRRGPARLLLLAMVESHADEPGRAFDLDELFEIGWPGQNIDVNAANKRVYAAIGTLRRLGLDDVIVTTDEGYLIAPTVVVRRSSVR